MGNIPNRVMGGEKGAGRGRGNRGKYEDAIEGVGWEN